MHSQTSKVVDLESITKALIEIDRSRAIDNYLYFIDYPLFIFWFQSQSVFADVSFDWDDLRFHKFIEVRVYLSKRVIALALDDFSLNSVHGGHSFLWSD